MKALLTIVIALVLRFSPKTIADESIEEAIAFLLCKGEYALEKDVVDHSKTSMAESLFTRFNPAVKEGLYLLLESEDYEDDLNLRLQAYHSIGIVGSLAAEDSDFSRLENVIERLEKSEFEDAKKVSELRFAYLAASRFGFEVSKEFFLKRINSDYWEDYLPVFNNGTQESPGMMTARTLAVAKMNALGSEEGNDFLADLLKLPDFYNDEMMTRVILGNMRTKQTRKEVHEANRVFFAGFTGSKGESSD